MTAQGHDHLSIRLGQGGDGRLQGVPGLLEPREFLSWRMPPALELAGDQAMLRVCLIVLCKGPRRFVLDLLELQAKRLGRLTLRRLIGLRRLETGLSGQRADRRKHLLAELFLDACTTKAQTVLASSTTIPPAHITRRRTAFTPRAHMQFAATTATAQQSTEQPMALTHRRRGLVLRRQAVRLGGNHPLMVYKPLPTDRGFMVIREKHPRVVVALLHTLFPHAIVLTKRQGRVTLTVDIGPSVYWVVKHRLDRMRGWQWPYQLDLAMDRLVHRQLETLCVEPLQHLPDAPECAKLGKDQRHRCLHAHIGVFDQRLAIDTQGARRHEFVECAALGCVLLALQESGLQHTRFHHAQRAFHPQDQRIIGEVDVVHMLGVPA
jgi:hypothetical protein